MSPLASKALEIAVTQIGQEEKPRGSNWGHPVQDYLEVVSINFPASWCMAFVQWCLSRAEKDIHWIDNMPLYRSGGVLNVYNHTDPSKIFHTPEPGDIFIQDHGH